MSTDRNKIRANLRKSYDEHATERDSSPREEWKDKERSNFLELLLREQKKSLLEIGSGPGRDGKFFQDHGIETVCIDLSPAMVELCKQKGLQAYVMDIADVQLPDGSFEAIYSMNALLHLTKAEFPVALHRMDMLLKPGGMAYLGLYGGYEHEGVWAKDRYSPRRFFSFFSDDDLEREVRKVFDVLSFKRISLGPEDPLHFQSVILAKRPSN